MTGPAPDALTAALAGRYRVERPLGAGGMATVYLAHDLAHDREVALKVLRPELGSVLGAERFLAEIRVTARLGHPHIVTVLDSGQAGGFLYYALPLIRGQSLRDRMHHAGRLGVAEAVRIVGQIAGALDYAHRQGIVHRDIKPENILLFEGEAMLSDFGIALAVSEAGGTRLTSSGISLGTPLYMSPEQASGGADIGPASDQFSLAALAYEMLSGETPHAGATTHAIMARLLTETPTRLRVLRPDLPPGIDEAVARALSKTPADRFPGCGAFAATLQAASTTSDALPTVRYAHPGIAPKRTAWAPRIAVLLAVAALLSWRFAARARPPGRIDGTTTQITTSGHAYAPIISPDGSQVAYAERRCRTPADCLWAIVVRETGSDESRTIVDSLSSVFPYQWTGDGRWLLFSTDGGRLPAGQYAVSRLGERVIPMGQGTALFLPGSDTALRAEMNDGRHDHTLWIRTYPAPWTAATDSHPVFPPRDQVYLRAYRPSPRGRWWVYGWGNEHSENGLLATHDTTGHLIDSVTAPAITFFRWSPTGRGVILPLSGSGGSLNAFLRIAFDPANGHFGHRDTIALPLGVTAPGIYDLTPDGRSLAYQSDHLAEAKITFVTRGPTGRTEREVPIASATSPLSPAITPDGRTILYRSTQGSGESAVQRWWVADPNGGAARALTPPFVGAYASALTDEALYRVAFAAGDGSSVVRYRLTDGASRVVLARLPAIADLAVGDRDRILIVRARGDSVLLYDSTGAVLTRAGIADSIGSFFATLSSPDGAEFALFLNSPATAYGPDGNLDVPIMGIAAEGGALRTITTLHVSAFVPVAWGLDGKIHLQVRRGGAARVEEVTVDPRSGRQTVVGPWAGDQCLPALDRRTAVCVEWTWLSDIFLFRGTTPIQ